LHDRLVNQLKQRDGIMEDLKMLNKIEWVQLHLQLFYIEAINPSKKAIEIMDYL
jgi:hypothetical protein